MMAKSLPADVQDALRAAQRSPGWNVRSATVRQFDVDGFTLYVVPARVWAYRRADRIAEAWRQAHARAIK